MNNGLLDACVGYLAVVVKIFRPRLQNYISGRHLALLCTRNRTEKSFKDELL